MHGLIGQKRLFSRLFDICGHNCNMENVHSTTRNIYSHWKTSFTELIAIFINSKFVSFCLCWLEGFTHLVCRFFYYIKKITVEVTAGAPSLPMHFNDLDAFRNSMLLLIGAPWSEKRMADTADRSRRRTSHFQWKLVPACAPPVARKTLVLWLEESV